MEAANSIPRSRRRAARHLARGLGLSALTAALLALPALPARGAVAGGSAVVVDGPSGAPREFSGEEIEGADDVETHTATLRANAGEAGEPIGIPKSLSVEGLIRLAGGEPAATGYITVPRPNGTVAYLRLADLPGPPEGPASFWVDQGCTHFFRPAIGAGANAEDNIASCGASLAVGVRDGAILAVAATASPSTASAGQAIEFTATATGAEPGEELSYVWNFGDGTSAAGTTVDHPFAAGGSYRVRVTATGTDESGGESAPLTVVVGSPPAGAGVGAGPEAPKAKTKPRGTGGRKGTGANGGGKDGRGGTGENGNGGKGRNGGTGAGAGKGTAGGKGNGAEGSDGTAAGAPGLNGGADESGAAEESDPTAEPAPTTEPFPIPEPPPSEASPFSEVPLPEPVSPPASPEAVVPPPAQAAAPTKSPGPDASAPGRTVRGQLVADLFEAGSSDSGAGGSTADPASESFASAPPAGGGSIPVAALAAAALLAAGVLFEWRRRPGRGLR